MLELLTITLHDLIDPKFYILHGGIWVLLFIVFAETGLMFGFFLPGDSLLFVAGIYSGMLIDSIFHGGMGNNFLDLVVLWGMVSVCGILGNYVGYWFGHKSGPFLFHRKDNWLFKKRHLYQAKDFSHKPPAPSTIFAPLLPTLP